MNKKIFNEEEVDLIRRNCEYVNNSYYELGFFYMYIGLEKQYENVINKYQFFKYSISWLVDSLWKNLFCIFDESNERFKDTVGIKEILGIIKKRLFLNIGQYNDLISIIGNLEKYLEKEKENINLIKKTRNLYFHPKKGYMTNSIDLSCEEKVSDGKIQEILKELRNFYSKIDDVFKFNFKDYNYETMNEYEEILYIIDKSIS